MQGSAARDHAKVCEQPVKLGAPLLAMRLRFHGRHPTGHPLPQVLRRALQHSPISGTEGILVVKDPGAQVVAGEGIHGFCWYGVIALFGTHGVSSGDGVAPAGGPKISLSFSSRPG